MENKRNEILTILICILIILPLFLISIYDRPSVDDYNYAILTHKVVENKGNIFQLIKAAWDTNINFYNSWQGLYTSAFILSLQPGIFGESYYSFTILIVTAISYLCLLISTNILNKHFVKKSFLYTLTVTTVIFTIIMLWLPSATEGLYWYNGAMNYIPFLFFTILNLSIIYDSSKTSNISKKTLLLIISIILSFLISGGNHVTSFANILSLLFLIIVFLKKDIKNNLLYLLPFFSACVGFCIMYMAPGTQVRQELLNKQGIIETILATANHLIIIIPKWCSFSWLIAILLSTSTAIDLAQRNKEKFSDRFPWLEIICCCCIIAGMFCVPYMAMGGFGAPRVTNVIWIAFMILSWISYFLIIGYLVKKDFINVEKIKNEKRNKNMNILIFICLLVLFIVPDRNNYSNSLIAIWELKKGIAYSYSVEMDERIEKYNNKNLSELGVYPLKNKSNLLFFNDLKTDPNECPNTYMGKYYNKIIYLIEE